MDDKHKDALHNMLGIMASLNVGYVPTLGFVAEAVTPHLPTMTEAVRAAIQAIEALAKVRENIDAAVTPADMIYALYAVTEPCANVNGPVQNCKVADMAAMVDADKWLDPATPIADVDAELVRAGGNPEAIGARGAALVADLVKKRAQVFDPAKVRVLLDRAECSVREERSANSASALLAAVRAVREGKVP